MNCPSVESSFLSVTRQVYATASANLYEFSAAERYDHMAGDFSTAPEFERQLEWMRTFVREEVWPIEAIEDRLTQADLDRINAPLQEQGRERGLWRAHLP